MVTNLDIAIIVVYLAGMTVVSYFLSRGITVEGYFVNKRKTSLTLLILSIVSTNVGAAFFIGSATEAYQTGISFGLVMISLVISGSFILAYFGPKIKRFGDEKRAYTLPEFFIHRYDSEANRKLVAVIILLSYLFLIALQFVAIGAIASVITDVDIRMILIVAGAITIIYTTMSGIRSNLFTDAISFVITAVILAILIPQILVATDYSLPQLEERYYDMFAFGGPSFYAFAIIFGTLGALLQMELWQRIYAANNEKTARKAFIGSAFIQIPFIAVGIIIGLTAASLYPGLDNHIAPFYLMQQLLPAGLLGLGLVALLAIVMDTINSLVMVGSSTILNDFYKPRTKTTDERKLLRLGRIFTLAYGFGAIGIAFLIPDIVSLLLIGAFMLMPIAPALVGGLIWRGSNSKASFISILAGFVVTILLIPQMPQTAFVPGFLVALAVFVGGSLIKNRMKKTVSK